MARVKINLPDHFDFTTTIPVRVTDLNYGNHVGNQHLLAYAHEARLAYLAWLGYTEMDVEGTGLIMADAEISYKAEIFYPDDLTIAVACNDFNRMGFDIVYNVMLSSEKTAAIIKTGMVCFDYKSRKISPLPEKAKKKLEQYL